MGFQVFSEASLFAKTTGRLSHGSLSNRGDLWNLPSQSLIAKLEQLKSVYLWRKRELVGICHFSETWWFSVFSSLLKIGMQGFGEEAERKRHHPTARSFAVLVNVIYF